MTNIQLDLEDLERKARAAFTGPWTAANSNPSDYCAVLYDDNTGDMYEVCDDCTPVTASHIAANSPPVTLALIARIRRLEEELARAAGIARAHGENAYAEDFMHVAQDREILP